MSFDLKVQDRKGRDLATLTLSDDMTVKQVKDAFH